MNAQPLVRTCKECSCKLNGRSDQKFCSDFCRNTYNNRTNSLKNEEVRKINAILRRNHRILARHVPKGIRQLNWRTLAEEGFNFQFYTHTKANQNGQVYTYCYDFGYLRTSKDQCLLVHQYT
jgi:hypothetical protein